MKSNAREVLAGLGSERASNLGWRDMWAMVTRKGDSTNRATKTPFKAPAEVYSKSTEFHSWGAPVSLKVQVPLASLQGIFTFIFQSLFFQVLYNFILILI